MYTINKPNLNTTMTIKNTFKNSMPWQDVKKQNVSILSIHSDEGSSMMVMQYARNYGRKHLY